MITVAWLVPDLIDGSGGHRTILQNAHHLQECGYRVRIHLERNPGTALGESLQEAVRRRFGYAMQEVVVGWNDFAPCDVLVATAWHSARHVRDAKVSCHKVYFVQDLESQFAPAGYFQLIAENSYTYGLVPITIGNWLRHELRQRFGITSLGFDFCADRSVYHPLPGVQREFAVCFIHQPEKPRRAHNLGLEALNIVKFKNPAVKIYTYGSVAKPSAAFQHQDLGLLDLAQCNALYNRCAVGLCLSATNPSRVPFEMMAAGLPVVELHRDNTLYDFPDDAALLCKQTPEALAEGILALLAAPDRRARMSAAGVAFMKSRDMPVGLQQFARSIEWIATSPIGASPPEAPREILYRRPAVTGGCNVADLEKVPELRRRQRIRRWLAKHLGKDSALRRIRLRPPSRVGAP